MAVILFKIGIGGGKSEFKQSPEAPFQTMLIVTHFSSMGNKDPGVTKGILYWMVYIDNPPPP